MKWKLMIVLLSLPTTFGPPLPVCSVSAKEGETAILPVEVNLTQFPELSEPWIKWEYEAEEVVHQYRGQDYYVNQVKRFRNRTSLFKEEFKKGNFSLKISNLNKSDEGLYICEVLPPNHPENNKSYNVSLCVLKIEELVGSSSGPDQTTVNHDENGVVIGGVTGGVIGVVLLILLSVILYKKCKPADPEDPANQAAPHQQTPSESLDNESPQPSKINQPLMQKSADNIEMRPRGGGGPRADEDSNETKKTSPML